LYEHKLEGSAQLMTDKEMLCKRDRDAEALGEGSWRSKASGKWCVVDVTFYPKTKLWIKENGKRREITRAELDRDYEPLKI
jgi:hypothetical protein